MLTAVVLIACNDSADTNNVKNDRMNANSKGDTTGSKAGLELVFSDNTY